MSAARNLPPLYHDQPPEQPRRRNWKKIVAWTAGGILLAIVLIVVAVVVLVHTQAFRNYVLNKAEQSLSAALNTRVHADRFALSWSGISPTVDLYRITIAGAAPYPNPPILRADHLHVAVRVTSLIQRTWNIQDLTLDRPIVHVYVDAKGNDNIPQMSSSSGSSSGSTNVFTLGIRHAALNSGAIYYNNIKSTLAADLRDLHLNSRFVVGQSEYTGNLGYSRGVIRMTNYNPLPNSLEAQFVATPSEFLLKNAVVRSGQSRITLNASLKNYSDPVITAQYNASLNAGEFAKILKNPSLPAGTINASGTMAYHPLPNQPMLAGVTAQGQISSPQLAVNSPKFKGDVRHLGASYQVANGNLRVNDIHANLLGGALTGSMETAGLAGTNPHSVLNAKLNGVSLAQVKSVAGSSAPALANATVTGTANANLHATWGKSLNNLVAQTNLNLQGSMTPPSGGAAVPLSGQVHAVYNGATKQLALNNSYLKAGQMAINLNGGISTRSALRINMQSVDLKQLASLATSFGVKLPPNLGLGGIASFVGTVSGSTAAPHIVGELTVNGLQFKGTSWRLLRTGVNASPAQAALQNGALVALNGGQVGFNFSTGLQHWSFTNTSPFRAGVNVSRIDLAPVTKAFAPSTPMTGVLNANLRMSGTELSPNGTGSLSLTNAKVSGQPIQSLNANVQANGTLLNASLRMQLPAGSANGTLSYDTHQQTFTANLRVPGLRLGQLAAVKARGMNLTGVLNLVANANGSIHNPNVQLNAQVPSLVMNGQKLSALTLAAAVRNHVANFDLGSQAINTSLRAQGTVQTVGEYFGNITVDTQKIPLAPLLAAYAPSVAGKITGQTELHASVRGPLKFPKQVEAHVSIPQLSLNYDNAVQLAAVQPIKADYVNGVARIQPAEIKGTDTDLQFQGTIPVTSAAPASFRLVGGVDLSIAQLLMPNVTSGGQLQLNINTAIAAGNSNVEGQIRIVNATFASPGMPVSLQAGNGVLTLTRDRLNVTEFSALVGGGTVHASGGVVYRPSLRFELTATGNDMRVLIPGGIRSTLDTDLSLVGTPQTATLRGKVNVAQLGFTPGFDVMDFVGSLGGGAAPPPPSGSFMSDLKLDVGVSTGNGVNLVSRTLTVQGNANLRLVGTAAQPVVLGRVNLTGGDVILLGNDYTIQRGTIDMVNASTTQPVLNLEANTTIQQYYLQVRMWGPSDHLQTSYTSVPALPPADIIHLIAFGSTTEAPGTLGAESVVASGVTSALSSRLEKIAGISQLSIDPELGGAGKTPGARIAIQQRVTSKIYVTFATDVTSTQNSVIKLDYHATPRFTVSGTRDQNGGFGFDTSIRKDW